VRVATHHRITVEIDFDEPVFIDDRVSGPVFIYSLTFSHNGERWRGEGHSFAAKKDGSMGRSERTLVGLGLSEVPEHVQDTVRAAYDKEMARLGVEA